MDNQFEQELTQAGIIAGVPEQENYQVAKKYRFTVTSSSMKDMEFLVKSFNFLTESKTLYLEVYDIIFKKDDEWQDNPWLAWAEKFAHKLTNETLTLTTFDSYNEPIMQYNFVNVSPIGAIESYAYDTIDTNSIKIECCYLTYERKFLYKK